MVAKSYQGLQQNGEPFKTNGRMYVNVITRTGAQKTVRWYSEAEYARLYPEETKAAAPLNQREIFGFTKGYITLFKGDTYANLEWFKQSNARYATFWGWYVVSTEEVPIDLPSDITPVQLKWEDVAASDVSLKPEKEITAFVETLLNDPSPSEHMGTVGGRLEVELTIQKAIPMETNWGHSTLHVMVDRYENVYIWQTSARQLVEGNTYLVRGRVKEHSIRKGVKQTILSHCAIGE